MEGTLSQILYMDPSFDFMIKNGKLFVIVFFSLHKMKHNTSIKNLRYSSLHIHHCKYFGRIVTEIFTFKK